MSFRVIPLLKEWKEIIVLLAAISGLYVATPKNEQPPQRENPATTAALERLTHAVDSLNVRVQALSAQIDALVRMQCAKPDRRTLALAGVACHNSNGD